MFVIPVETVILWTLIFVRISGVMFALPIFGEDPVPIRVRVLASVAMCLIVVPLVKMQNISPSSYDILSFLSLVIREILIGLVVGYFARVMFEGFVRMSSICGYQMGFGSAGMLIPSEDQQSTAFDSLHRIMVIVIFFSLNLHHVFIGAIFDSFSLIPLGTASLPVKLAPHFIAAVSSMIVIILKLTAPILVALTFTMAAMGLISRVVPQMNVFTLSFPVSFYVGLSIYLSLLPLFPGWFLDVMLNKKSELTAIMRTMAM